MKKILVVDGVNNETEKFESSDEAKKWILECFTDKDEGIHPDIESVKIYEQKYLTEVVETKGGYYEVKFLEIEPLPPETVPPKIAEKRLGENEINRIEFLVDCCLGYLLVKGKPDFEKINETKELLYNDVEEMIVRRNAEMENLKEDLTNARRCLGEQQEEIEILKHENEQLHKKIV